MEVLRSENGKLTLELEQAEAVLIANALNEVCNGIEVWEFSRLGASRDAALSLLARFSEALGKA